MSQENIEIAQTTNQKKLVQDEFNVNVAFYIHLKTFDDSTRKELKQRIKEVFFFSKGVHWKFDSFGIEKPGSRGPDILGYFVFRTSNVEKLKKLFLSEFKDYENASKITCSVAKYEKISETFFELEF
ncbi:hypothetical protein KO488_10930 [Poseidonibacter lekithochrous]|uniref:hypothetical protein n=1 Tax=Poseidonibacter TaxID=2321187 RepID=UPI001C080F15|nr:MULTISPECIES: hypothetical protein [Poseidonibacter]MBU3015274.1 hypothetical protein [Poseidonibacter lekithochrous]MDO6828572.1 hypothetical protein [Poseidonibacter sp. 1_MG-2023]